MDDRLRETLSAMMDDEADELSVRRLLSHHQQADIRAQWRRWQGIHDLMHNSHVPVEDRDGLEPVQGVDVSAGVREALAGHSGPPTTASSRPGRWQWSAIAMIAAALLVGFGAGTGWDSKTVSSDALASSTTATEAGVADPGVAAEAAQVPEIALQGLDEEQWQHVSRYLLEHAQHNSVAAGQGSVGYARLVSASGDY